jgi:hypothetical protein
MISLVAWRVLISNPNKSNFMAVFEKDLIVFIDELTALQMLLVHHGPRYFLVIVVEGVWVYSLQPIIEVLLEHIGPGD